MSIAQHIIDHARAVHFGSVDSELSPANDKTHHFKFSIDTAQLIAKGYQSKEQIDARMLVFFDELKSLQYQYTESKGYTRHGKQRFRTRTLDMTSALIAYHNSSFKHKTDLVGSKGETVLADAIGQGNTEPHFHIRFSDKDKDRGKDYVNARNAIAELAKKHRLVFHFMENAVSEDREQETRLSNFSWGIQNAKNQDIAYYVSESDKLTANLDLLAKDAQKGNLQFYVKVLNNLQGRLQAQNLDFFWHGVNIKETFPLYLNQKEQSSLETIASGNISAINDLLNDRSNKIARAYLEHCAGFENHIINELLKRDYMLPRIDLSALDLSKAQKPQLKEYFKKDRSSVDAQKAARAEPKTKQLKQAFEKQEYKEVFTANNEVASAVSIKRKDYLERQKLIDAAKVELQDTRATFVNEALGYLSSTPQAMSELESELEIIKSATTGKFGILGGAGSGKSYQARQIIESEEANGRKVLKLGSTGLAACNIGGQTIHSAFGIGIASTLQELEAFERKNRKIVDKALETIKAADTIIIDEISMVSKEQMDLLEYRLKQAGWNGKLIFVGDFLQLKAVAKKDKEPGFAFESNLWSDTKVTTSHGNKRTNEVEFIDVLNRVRYGQNDDKIIDYLADFAAHEVDESKATYIFATNRQVNAHNEQKLHELSGQLHTYQNTISSERKLTAKEVEEFFSEVPIEQSFEAKLGAKVLLLQNDPKNNLFNGDRAVVTALQQDSITVKLERDGREINISKKQYEAEITKNDKTTTAKIEGYPIRLSYGITAHKSQGMSLDHVVVNASNIFTHAQFYIGLSRAKNPETLRIDYQNEEDLSKAIKVDTKALKYVHSHLDHTQIDQAKAKLEATIKAQKLSNIKLTKELNERVETNYRNARAHLADAQSAARDAKQHLADACDAHNTSRAEFRRNIDARAFDRSIIELAKRRADFERMLQRRIDRAVEIEEQKHEKPSKLAAFSKELLEDIVDKAIDSLPEEFKAAIEPAKKLAKALEEACLTPEEREALEEALEASKKAKQALKIIKHADKVIQTAMEMSI